VRNVIKIDYYNFELSHFKVGAFLRHTIHIVELTLPRLGKGLSWY